MDEEEEGKADRQAEREERERDRKRDRERGSQFMLVEVCKISPIAVY